MQAVADLIPLAVALVCLGLAYILILLVFALFHAIVDLLNLIPKVHIGTTWLDGVKQSVWHALGVAYHGIDSAIGWQMHQMGRLLDWTWREFKAHGVLIAALANPVAALLLAYHALKHQVTSHNKALDHARRRLKTLEKEYHGIDKQVRTLEKEWHGIDELHIRKRLKTLDKELARIDTQVIPNIRSIAQGAETDVTALQKWITRNVPLLGTTALVGAVAWALSALGLGWTRCANNGNLGKTLCGLENGLFNDMLGALFAAAAIADFRELVKVAQTVEHEAATGVKDLLQV